MIGVLNAPPLAVLRFYYQSSENGVNAMGFKLLPAVCLLLAVSVFAQDDAFIDDGDDMGPAQDAGDEPWFETELNIPYLESGKVGELPEGAEEETRVWPHALPFFAQNVIDMGYELPEPYGIRPLVMSIDQDLDLRDLAVNLNDGDRIEVPWVNFETGKARHNTVQFSADVWLLPFMNVFVSVGHVDGTSSIPLSFPGDEALKLLVPSLGARCDKEIARPETCDRVFNILAEPGFTGESVAVGTNLAMGWKQFFVTGNLTYAHAGISLVNEEIHTLTGSIRGGMLFPTASGGRVSTYVGAMYLDVEVTLTGQLVIPLSDDPEVGRDFLLDFEIVQQNSDPVNYVAGAVWDINEHWNLMLEGGFGGSRSHVAFGAGFRF